MTQGESADLKITLDGVSDGQKREFAQELSRLVASQEGVTGTRLRREDPDAQDAGTAILFSLEVGVAAFQLYQVIKDYHAHRTAKSGVEIVISGEAAEGQVVFTNLEDPQTRERFRQFLAGLGIVRGLPDGERPVDGTP